MIIKRKYPEQREFGIISRAKKLVNKGRRNLAASILKSAKKDIKNQYDNSLELEKNLKKSSKRSEVMKNSEKRQKKEMLLY